MKVTPDTVVFDLISQALIASNPDSNTLAHSFIAAQVDQTIFVTIVPATFPAKLYHFNGVLVQGHHVGVVVVAITHETIVFVPQAAVFDAVLDDIDQAIKDNVFKLYLWHVTLLQLDLIALDQTLYTV